MNEVGTILESLKSWWPILNTFGLILFTIMSMGWRQIGKRLDHLTNAVQELTRSHNQTSTAIAVVQSNLQNHTDHDRETFHEIRNDVGRRLDAQRATVETLTAALLRAGVSKP